MIAWHDIASICPWATYFHTPNWAGVIEKTFQDFSIASKEFILDSGARVVMPFVLRSKRKIFIKKEFKSMEPGVYGGVIADRDISQQDMDQISEYLLRIKNASIRIVGNPFKNFSLTSGFKSKEMITHIVDLVPEFSIMQKKFSRGLKSNINQAKKKVTIRRAETEDDIERYYEIYKHTVNRWGESASTVFPIGLFMNIYMLKDPNAAFWLAEADGKIVAGIIVLSWNKSLIYWHGCALKQYFKYYPNNLLHATVMEWACEHGFEKYDMGASMSLEGVIRFKESFGAKPYKFMSYRL